MESFDLVVILCQNVTLSLRIITLSESYVLVKSSSEKAFVPQTNLTDLISVIIPGFRLNKCNSYFVAAPSPDSSFVDRQTCRSFSSLCAGVAGRLFGASL